MLVGPRGAAKAFERLAARSGDRRAGGFLAPVPLLCLWRLEALGLAPGASAAEALLLKPDVTELESCEGEHRVAHRNFHLAQYHHSMLPYLTLHKPTQVLRYTYVSLMSHMSPVKTVHNCITCLH